jgi:hypothetical protein
MAKIEIIIPISIQVRLAGISGVDGRDHSADCRQENYHLWWEDYWFFCSVRPSGLSSITENHHANRKYVRASS